MRMPEEHYTVGCPTEEEMDKEIMLMLIEQYKLWEIALKIYRHWYHNGYDEWKAEGYDEWYEHWCDKCCDDYSIS